MVERSLDLSANIGNYSTVLINGILLPTTPSQGYIKPNITGWYCRIRDAYTGQTIISPVNLVYETNEGLYFGFDSLSEYQRTFHNPSTLKISFHRTNGKHEKPSIVVYGELVSSSSSSSSMSYVYGELDEHGIEVLPPPEWSDILHADEDDYSPSTSSSSSESSSGNSVSYVIAIQEGLSEETKNRRVIGVIQGEDNISTKVHMAIVPYFLNNPPQEYPTDPYVRWFICPLNAMG